LEAYSTRQTIPKPPGQAGALNRGGYSLEAHLNWEPGLYSTVQVISSFHLRFIPGLSNFQRFVRDRLKHYIDAGSLMPDHPITRQPPGIIATIQEEVCLEPMTPEAHFYRIFQASKEFPFLAKYEGNWPMRDMISRYLSKSHRSRKRSQG